MTTFLYFVAHATPISNRMRVTEEQSYVSSGIVFISVDIKCELVTFIMLFIHNSNNL